MKKKTKVILAILLFMMFVFVSNFAFADVGNINRYDSGGSDYSYDSNYDYNDDYHSDSGDLGAIIWLILLFVKHPVLGIIAIIILITVIIRSKYPPTARYYDSKNNYVQNNSNVNNNLENNINSSYSFEQSVASRIQEIDPNFSEEAFLSWVRDVFIKIQQAWTERNWKAIRPFESNELFETHQAQLQEYIDNNKINVIEKISIKSCNLLDFKQDGDKEVVTVSLSAVMRDYVIDATSKQVLESDPNKDWNMSYIMTFARKSGVKTQAGTSKKSTTNCPNCGAPTEITSAGQCEYCGSVITTGEYDFVLTDIKGN